MPRRKPKPKETASSEELSPMRVEKAPEKPHRRLRLNRREEQVVLTRLATGEGLKEVQARYRKEVREEIRNLRAALEAGEYDIKDGVWYLIS